MISQNLTMLFIGVGGKAAGEIGHGKVKRSPEKSPGRKAAAKGKHVTPTKQAMSASEDYSADEFSAVRVVLFGSVCVSLFAVAVCLCLLDPLMKPRPRPSRRPGPAVVIPRASPSASRESLESLRCTPAAKSLSLLQVRKGVCACECE